MTRSGAVAAAFKRPRHPVDHRGVTYEVRDIGGLTLAREDDEARAVAALRAYAATAPGREDDLVLVACDAGGHQVGPARDVFDV